MKKFVCFYSNPKDPIIKSFYELCEAEVIACKFIFLSDLIHEAYKHGIDCVAGTIRKLRDSIDDQWIFVDRIAVPLGNLSDNEYDSDILILISKLYMMTFSDFGHLARQYQAVRLGPPWKMLKLTTQWHALRSSSLDVAVPRQVSGQPLEKIVADLPNLIITDEARLYHWKPATLEERADLLSEPSQATQLLMERPAGDHFLILRTGACCRILKTSSVSNADQDAALDVFAKIADYFDLQVGEGLIFKNADGFTFGMISNYAYTLEDQAVLTAGLRSSLEA